ncbi:uncharacterized protein BDCG_16617 [Blastomyces dermatitidis ER-3]|uniref:Uncharacterized protein n=1 Tax=Ajellomyces dermatitidis (strain ER-3 / ATCC MYA-2586) TaxID=559297 RepID=A0ABX2VTB9_AJEDR|nr:uncharacterized protein BDCG_16617 [Blastomyces dermatitidis ER-3]OAT00433.1 hypothetical protein BDCG_16617 [Blastomyces dermatitidis ER-3]
MTAGGAEKESDTDKPTGRGDNVPLQGMVTTAAAAREAEGGGEEGVAMRAVLPRLIDITTSTFNLAFLAVMEAAAAS